MNDIYNNQRVRDCHCPCHCHCPCIHQDYFNKSEIISDINVQNPNSEFLTSNCINESPLYSQKNYIIILILLIWKIEINLEK